MKVAGRGVWESYKPNDYQKAFHECPARSETMVKGFIGAQGAGKSTSCENEQVELCMRMPNGLSIATRKSQKRSRFSLLDDYQKILYGIASWNQRDEVFKFKNGHQLIVAPSDDPQRFGSWEICSFFMQEAQEIDGRIFDMLVARLRHKQAKIDGNFYYRGYIDARGVTSSHWINKEFIEKAWNYDRGPAAREQADNPDYVYFRARTEQNRANLPTGYIERERRRHKGDITWLKVFLEGEVGLDVEGQAVFGDSWDAERHVVDEIPEDPSLPMLRGWDFGFRAPALLWAQYTRSGRLLILRELCPDNLSTDELLQRGQAEQIRLWESRPRYTYRDYGDIAGEQISASASQTDIEKVENFFSTAVESRKARIEDGLNVIRKLMRDSVKVGGRLVPRFAIARDCVKTIEALGGAYHYKEGANLLDRLPVKGNGYDRCFVAGTPVATETGSRPIEEIRVGDMVETRLGLRPVIACGETGKRQTITAELSNGLALTGTANHPIFVNVYGWLPLNELRYGDKLLAWKSESTAEGLTPSTQRPATSTAESGYTEKSIWQRLAQSLRDITSTTGTRTSRTTWLQTWNAFLRASIGLGTVASSPRTAAFAQGDGTLLLLVATSTDSTVRTHGSGSSRLTSSAITAASRFSRNSRGLSSAPTLARAEPDGRAGSTTSTENAASAERRSEPTVTRESEPAPVTVRSVSVGKRERVYNLTVAGQPEFFASGVLVHNCIDALRYIAQLVVEEGYVPAPSAPSTVRQVDYFGSYGYGR